MNFTSALDYTAHGKTESERLRGTAQITQLLNDQAELHPSPCGLGGAYFFFQDVMSPPTGTACQLSIHLSRALAHCVSLKTTPQPTRLCLCRPTQCLAQRKHFGKWILKCFHHSPRKWARAGSAPHREDASGNRQVLSGPETKVSRYPRLPKLGLGMDGGEWWPIWTYVFLNKPVG